MSKENETAIKQDDQEPVTEQREQAPGRGDIEQTERSRQEETSDANDATPESDGRDSAEAEVASEMTSEDAAVDTPTLEDLTRMLEEEGKKAEENWNALLRTQAEMENLRKRSARDLDNAHKYGLERFVAELLPVKDSLELGLAAAREGDSNPGVAQLNEGVELTLKMLKTALEKFGIEEVDPQGEAFNPDYHQAMSMQQCENKDSGTVLTVVQKGYLLKRSTRSTGLSDCFKEIVGNRQG